MQNRFTRLEGALAKLNGKEAKLNLKPTTPRDFEFLKELETTGKEFEWVDIYTGEDGFFKLGAEKVVIYIKDHNGKFKIKMKEKEISNKEEFISTPRHLHRFHLCDCEVLEKMKPKNGGFNLGRYERFVASQRKDGFFEIDLLKAKEEVKLLLCKKCLNKLNEKLGENFNIHNFDIGKHLKSHDTKFTNRARYTDKTAPKNEYPSNWKEISARYRKLKNWKCEKCGKDFSNDRGNLHTHHINSLKYDSRPSNLKALCKVCHNDEHPEGNIIH